MIVTAALGLELVSVIDRGVDVNERVHFVVTRDMDLSFFIIMATIGAAPNKVFPGSRPTYWFESRNARAGDHIILYTTVGTNKVQKRDDGLNNHFFYWGTSGPLFGYANAKVVIAELNRWETRG